MHTALISSPSWSTASFSDVTNTSQPELSALVEHLDRCKRLHGRLFTFYCAAESMNGFVAARFVTTLAVASLLIGFSFLIF